MEKENEFKLFNKVVLRDESTDEVSERYELDEEEQKVLSKLIPVEGALRTGVERLFAYMKENGIDITGTEIVAIVGETVMGIVFESPGEAAEVKLYGVVWTTRYVLEP